MKYYWVNQGSTWKTERTDGFLWAPLLNKKGKELSHWTILKELEPGDIVFSYVKKNIPAVSFVAKRFKHYDRPKEFDKNLSWNNKGMRVDVNYIDINPLKISEIKKNILPFKKTFEREEDWMFQKDLNIKQKYLMPISSELGKYLLSLTEINFDDLDILDLNSIDKDMEKEIFNIKPKKIKKGQGYGKAENNKIIEDYAMEFVKKEMKKRGYAVKDVSSERGPGCDFIFTKNDEVIYGEVKGTSNSDSSVLITKNEYEKSKEYGLKSALYIVHNIVLDKSKGKPNPWGGRLREFYPWNPDINKNCDVVSYKFFCD